MTPTPTLEVDRLTVSFSGPAGRVRVVEEVSFNVERGRILGLVGESGSGKTVSCLATMGLLDRRVARVEHGAIRLDGVDLLGMSARNLNRVRGRSMAMIFQEPMTSLNPAFTVGDQIAEGLRTHRGLTRRAALARATDLLAVVGIPHPTRVIHAYPHSFSGGMRQRVMIAMAVACEPTLLIADEPTTALDVTVQAQILELIRRMRDELGLAVLFITHDLGVIADICDDVVVMYAGQVAESAPVDELFEHPRHPYTEGLLAATPTLDAAPGSLGVIPGQVPLPADLPTGCRFADRCPYAVAACSQPQTLAVVGERHASACGRAGDLVLEGVN